MVKKSNQHYVPRFYFNFFSTDKKTICVLNRKNGATYKLAPIKSQASKNYFYGNETIEDALSNLEGHFSTVLRQLNESNSFDKFESDNLLLLLQNIMLQRSRTVTSRNNKAEFYDLITEYELEVFINNDQTLSDEEKEVLRKEQKNIRANPKPHQLMEMKINVELANHLSDLMPIILLNRTNRPFIFGDAPVIFINPYQKRIKFCGVLGAKASGLLIYYPISPSRAVLLVDSYIYKVKKLINSVVKLTQFSDIANLNKLQIHNAANTVYFSEYKYADYVSELWRQERNALSNDRGAVVEAPGVDQSGNGIGDIIHTFEHQLPLIPKFSFLQHSEVNECTHALLRDNFFLNKQSRSDLTQYLEKLLCKINPNRLSNIN